MSNVLPAGLCLCYTGIWSECWQVLHEQISVVGSVPWNSLADIPSMINQAVAIVVGECWRRHILLDTSWSCTLTFTCCMGHYEDAHVLTCFLKCEFFACNSCHDCASWQGDLECVRGKLLAWQRLCMWNVTCAYCVAKCNFSVWWLWHTVNFCSHWHLSNAWTCWVATFSPNSHFDNA